MYLSGGAVDTLLVPGHSLQAGTEDVKAVISQLSELRHDMQTNKEMPAIQSGQDLKAWNAVFERYGQIRRMQGKKPQWFTVSWLFAECYMYRRIYEILQGRWVGQRYCPRKHDYRVKSNVSLSDRPQCVLEGV